MSAGEIEHDSRRGLRYALLAAPTVQAVRFATKLALAWFVLPQAFGEVGLAALLAFGVSQLAILGLDEATVCAPRLERPTWRRLRRIHLSSGALLGSSLLVAGAATAAWTGHATIGAMLAAFGPMVALANHGVLPAALIIRHGRYRDLFVAEALGISAYALATVGAAFLGAGAWSLVLGLWANALVQTAEVVRRARPLVPAAVADAGPAADSTAATADLVRHGRHLLHAGALGFGSDRADSLAVFAVLGRAAFGLYEMAQHVATAALQQVNGLAERYVLPSLADAHRRGRLGESLQTGLHLLAVWILPAHLVLAVAAVPLVALLFPAGWQGAAPVLQLMALAAAARSVDVMCTAALKASTRSRAVVRLGQARLALLVLLVVPLALEGLLAAAAGALLARTLAAALSLALAFAAAGHAGARALAARSAAVLGAFTAAHVLVAPRLALLAGEHALAQVAVHAAVGGALWAVVRIAIDRATFRGEWAELRARLRVGGAGAIR